MSAHGQLSIAQGAQEVTALGKHSHTAPGASPLYVLHLWLTRGYSLPATPHPWNGWHGVHRSGRRLLYWLLLRRLLPLWRLQQTSCLLWRLWRRRLRRRHPCRLQCHRLLRGGQRKQRPVLAVVALQAGTLCLACIAAALRPATRLRKLCPLDSAALLRCRRQRFAAAAGVGPLAGAAAGCSRGCHSKWVGGWAWQARRQGAGLNRQAGGCAAGWPSPLARQLSSSKRRCWRMQRRLLLLLPLLLLRWRLGRLLLLLLLPPLLLPPLLLLCLLLCLLLALLRSVLLLAWLPRRLLLLLLGSRPPGAPLRRQLRHA